MSRILVERKRESEREGERGGEETYLNRFICMCVCTVRVHHLSVFIDSFQLSNIYIMQPISFHPRCLYIKRTVYFSCNTDIT